MRRYILLIPAIFVLSVFIVKMGPSQIYIQNLGSIMDVWKRSDIASSDSPRAVFFKSFKGFHGSLYRPLSVWIYSLFFRTHIHDSKRYECVFTFLTFISILSVFLFLQLLSGETWLSFFSSVVFALLPPFLFVAWKSFDTNIISLPLVFFSGLFFVLSQRNSSFLIPCVLLSVLAVLSGEAGRFYIVVLLLVLLIFYRENFVKRAVMFAFITVVVFVFLFIVTPGRAVLFGGKEMFGNEFKNFVYYSTFFVSNLIYSLGVITVASVGIFKMPVRSGPAVFLSLLPFMLFFPSYPFRNFEQFFMFMFDTPLILFLLFALIVYSLSARIVQGKREEKTFSLFIILSFAGILVGVLFYPYVRSDISSRTLLYTFPFFLFILFREIAYQKKKYLAVLVLVPLGYHIFTSGFNLKEEERAIREGMLKGVKTVKKMDERSRTRWTLVQVFIDYVLRDVFFPPPQFRHFRNVVIPPVLFEVDKFIDEIEPIYRNNPGNLYILVKRFRPSVYPFVFPLSENKGLFGEGKKMLGIGLKIKEMMMFYPEDTPVEKYLKVRGKLVWKIEEKYTFVPTFVNELFQRIFLKLPLRINSAFELSLYRL